MKLFLIVSYRFQTVLETAVDHASAVRLRDTLSAKYLQSLHIVQYEVPWSTVLTSEPVGCSQ